MKPLLPRFASQRDMPRATAIRFLFAFAALALAQDGTGLGSSAGPVIDPGGDPVQAANVQLMRAGRNLGERILVNFRGAITNDRGEYHMLNIEAGQYYLHVAVNGVNQELGGSRMLGAQYFGGAAEWKD